MELRQLAHFLAVAEERHFTRAAQRVHLTQSSLSSSIRLLERELGSELFVRSTRHVELTEAGRALTPAARRAVAASEDAKDAVAGVRGLVRGQLTIGAIQLRGRLDIPGLLARYHRRHPAVKLRLRHDSVTSLVRRTADGELELAIVDVPLGPQAGRVRAQALETEALLLAVAADGPLATRRRVRLAELSDHAFVEYRADSSAPRQHRPSLRTRRATAPRRRRSRHDRRPRGARRARRRHLPATPRIDSHGRRQTGRTSHRTKHPPRADARHTPRPRPLARRQSATHPHGDRQRA